MNTERQVVEQYSVTYTHAGVHAPSTEVFDELASGFGMHADMTYDVYANETVYRFWFDDIDLAQNVFVAIKDEKISWFPQRAQDPVAKRIWVASELTGGVVNDPPSPMRLPEVTTS